MSAAPKLSLVPAKYILRVTLGPDKGSRFRISPPGVVIGRDPQVCSVAINDPRVSRQQCRIDFSPEGLTIEDLSGKATTLVNDQPAMTTLLKMGDTLQFGDSKIIIEEDVQSTSPKGKSLLSELPKFSGISGNTAKKTPSTSSGPAKSYKGYMIIGGAALLITVLLFALPNAKKPAPPKVTSNADLDKSITEIQARQQEIETRRGDNLSERDRFNKYTAEKNFIRGIRDYQNGKYTRALEAFQTTLAVDPKHSLARRYFKLADKKRQDSVDHHMDLGNKYKQKNMYRMCIAEFELVLQIINQPNNRKYQLAKEQIRVCRLCQGGQCTDESKIGKVLDGASQH